METAIFARFENNPFTEKPIAQILLKRVIFFIVDDMKIRFFRNLARFRKETSKGDKFHPYEIKTAN